MEQHSSLEMRAILLALAAFHECVTGNTVPLIQQSDDGGLLQQARRHGVFASLSSSSGNPALVKTLFCGAQR